MIYDMDIIALGEEEYAAMKRRIGACHHEPEGQMQRIAVARAIYSERPILLLDEATSALDAETEGRLLRNLRRMTERTVVIVTHRETVMRECDRVVRDEEYFCNQERK